MAASNAVDLDPMVTHEMSLEQSARGFEILDDYSDKVVKVMVHVSEED
jgi:threonine dehydrogenase-like Zn-dependent dehydrogenase